MCRGHLHTPPTMWRALGFILVVFMALQQRLCSGRDIAPNERFFVRMDGTTAQTHPGYSLTLHTVSAVTAPLKASGAGFRLNDPSAGVDVSPAVPLPAVYTVEAWVKTPLVARVTSQTYHTLIRTDTSQNPVLTDGDDMLGAFAGGTMYSSGFNMSTLADGWHHLFAVAKENSTTYYIDGRNVGTAAIKATGGVVNIGNGIANVQLERWGDFADLKIHFDEVTHAGPVPIFELWYEGTTMTATPGYTLSNQQSNRVFDNPDQAGDSGLTPSTSNPICQVSPAIPLTTAHWSVELWTKTPLNTVAQYNTLLRDANGGGEHPIIANNGVLGSWIGGTFRSSGFNINTLAPGWHHMLVTASNGVTFFYIDFDYAGGMSFQSNTSVVNIGGFSVDQPWGSIAGLKIFAGSVNRAGAAFGLERKDGASPIAAPPNSGVTVANTGVTGAVSLAQTGSFGWHAKYSSSRLSVSPAQALGTVWTIRTWIRTPLAAVGTGDHVLVSISSTDDAILLRNDSLQVGLRSGSTFISAGFDLQNASAGWHSLSVVASNGRQDFYLDGVKAGTVASIVSGSVTTIGNVAAGGQPWGEFSGFEHFSERVVLPFDRDPIVEIYWDGSTVKATNGYTVTNNGVTKLEDGPSQAGGLGFRADAAGERLELSPVVRLHSKWTITAYIRLPLPDSGAMHYLTHGREFQAHVAVSANSSVFGFVRNRNTADAFHAGLSVDSLLTPGWHLLRVVGTEEGTVTWIDGTFFSKITSRAAPATPIKFVGGLASSNPWGDFAQLRIYDDIVLPNGHNAVPTPAPTPAPAPSVIAACQNSIAQAILLDSPVVYVPLSDASYSAGALAGNLGSNTNVPPGAYSGNFSTLAAGQYLTCEPNGRAPTFSTAGRTFVAMDDLEELGTLTSTSGEFSVGAWVRVTGGQGTFRMVVDSRSDGVPEASGFNIYAGSDDKWALWMGDGTGWLIVAGGTVTLNKWTHVMGTRTAEGTASLHVDGQQVGQVAGLAMVLNLVDRSAIGSNTVDGALPADSQHTYHMEGQIAHVAWFNKALPRAAVYRQYAALCGRECFSPVYRVHFGPSSFNESSTGLGWEIDTPYLKSGAGTVITGTVSAGDLSPLYSEQRTFPTSSSVSQQSAGVPLYSFPLPQPGLYRVTLHFAETQHSAAGQRVFPIYVEGDLLMVEQFDIYSSAGGRANQPTALSWEVGVVDGALDISTRNSDKQSVALPFRMNCGSLVDVVAGDGNTWLSDNQFRFLGTTSAIHNDSDVLSGTTVPELYHSERHFTSIFHPLTHPAYVIPLPAAGSYSVSLHFAELFGVTNRSFHVYLEQQLVDTIVDLPDTPLVKNFTVNVVDASLEIAFSQIVDNPLIVAAEVKAITLSVPAFAGVEIHRVEEIPKTSQRAWSQVEDNFPSALDTSVWRSVGGGTWSSAAGVLTQSRLLADQTVATNLFTLWHTGTMAVDSSTTVTMDATLDYPGESISHVGVVFRLVDERNYGLVYLRAHANNVRSLSVSVRQNGRWEEALAADIPFSDGTPTSFTFTVSRGLLSVSPTNSSNFGLSIPVPSSWPAAGYSGLATIGSSGKFSAWRWRSLDFGTTANNLVVNGDFEEGSVGLEVGVIPPGWASADPPNTRFQPHASQKPLPLLGGVNSLRVSESGTPNEVYQVIGEAGIRPSRWFLDLYSMAHLTQGSLEVSTGDVGTGVRLWKKTFQMPHDLRTTASDGVNDYNYAHISLSSLDFPSLNFSLYEVLYVKALTSRPVVDAIRLVTGVQLRNVTRLGQSSCGTTFAVRFTPGVLYKRAVNASNVASFFAITQNGAAVNITGVSYSRWRTEGTSYDVLYVRLTTSPSLTVPASSTNITFQVLPTSRLEAAGTIDVTDEFPTGLSVSCRQLKGSNDFLGATQVKEMVPAATYVSDAVVCGVLPTGTAALVALDPCAVHLQVTWTPRSGGGSSVSNLTSELRVLDAPSASVADTLATGVFFPDTALPAVPSTGVVTATWSTSSGGVMLNSPAAPLTCGWGCGTGNPFTTCGHLLGANGVVFAGGPEQAIGSVPLIDVTVAGGGGVVPPMTTPDVSLFELTFPSTMPFNLTITPSFTPAVASLGYSLQYTEEGIEWLNTTSGTAIVATQCYTVLRVLNGAGTELARYLMMKPPAAAVTTIATLTTDVGVLDPPFSTSIHNYALVVEAGTTQVTFTSTLSAPGTSLAVNGVTMTNTSAGYTATVTLMSGVNGFDIVPDSVFDSRYTVKVVAKTKLPLADFTSADTGSAASASQLTELNARSYAFRVRVERGVAAQGSQLPLLFVRGSIENPSPAVYVLPQSAGLRIVQKGGLSVDIPNQAFGRFYHITIVQTRSSTTIYQDAIPVYTSTSVGAAPAFGDILRSVTGVPRAQFQLVEFEYFNYALSLGEVQRPMLSCFANTELVESSFEQVQNGAWDLGNGAVLTNSSGVAADSGNAVLKLGGNICDGGQRSFASQCFAIENGQRFQVKLRALAWGSHSATLLVQCRSHTYGPLLINASFEWAAAMNSNYTTFKTSGIARGNTMRCTFVETSATASSTPPCLPHILMDVVKIATGRLVTSYLAADNGALLYINDELIIADSGDVSSTFAGNSSQMVWPYGTSVAAIKQTDNGGHSYVGASFQMHGPGGTSQFIFRTAPSSDFSGQTRALWQLNVTDPGDYMKAAYDDSSWAVNQVSSYCDALPLLWRPIGHTEAFAYNTLTASVSSYCHRYDNQSHMYLRIRADVHNNTCGREPRVYFTIPGTAAPGINVTADDISSQYTIVVKAKAQLSGTGLVELWRYGNAAAGGLSRNVDGTFNMYYNADSIVSAQLPDTEWHEFAWVYAGPSGLVEMYVDGVKFLNTTQSVLTAKTTMTLGATFTNSVDSVHMAEFRVFAAHITQEEMTEVADYGYFPTRASLYIGRTDTTEKSLNNRTLTVAGGVNTVESSCHKYTAINECSTNNGNCDPLATCVDLTFGHACVCKQGYVGNGFSCVDVDECTAGIHGCASTGSQCTNLPGTYNCTCKAGYWGNGFVCVDINECDSPPTCANESDVGAAAVAADDTWLTWKFDTAGGVQTSGNRTRAFSVFNAERGTTVGAHCDIFLQLAVSGPLLQNLTVNKAGECCDACTSTATCLWWTFYSTSRVCSLLTNKTDSAALSTATAGGKGTATDVNALVFNGLTSVAEDTATCDLQYMRFTSAWVNPDTVGRTYPLVMTVLQMYPFGIFLYKANSSAQLSVVARYWANNGVNVLHDTSVTIPGEAWSHIAVEWNTTSISLFVNGYRRATVEGDFWTQTTCFSGGFTDKLTLGTCTFSHACDLNPPVSPTAGTQPFYGMMADVSVWGLVPTLDRIRRHAVTRGQAAGKISATAGCLAPPATLCDANAVCNNTVGSVNCVCTPPYTGSGLQCSVAEPITRWQFTSTEGWGAGVTSKGWVLDSVASGNNALTVVGGAYSGSFPSTAVLVDYLQLQQPATSVVPKVTLPSSVLGGITNGFIRLRAVNDGATASNHDTVISVHNGAGVALFSLTLTDRTTALFNTFEGTAVLTQPTPHFFVDLTWSVDPQGRDGRVFLQLGANIAAATGNLFRTSGVPQSLSISVGTDVTTNRRVIFDYMVIGREGVTNSFTAVPNVAVTSVSSFTVTYTPAQAGQSWGVVVPEGNSSDVDFFTVLQSQGTGGSSCGWSAVAVTNNTEASHTLTCTGLSTATAYRVLVYVEAGTASPLWTGSLRSAAFTTPSSVLVVAPTVTQVTTTAVAVSYTVSSASTVVGVVVGRSSAADVTAANVKALAVACRTTAAPAATGTATTLVISGCSLALDTPYSVFLYAEQGSTLGVLSAEMQVQTPTIDFAVLPSVSDITFDGMVAQFQAKADGRSWGIVRTTATAVPSAASVVAGTATGVVCSWTNLTVTASTPQQHTLSGCGFNRSTIYVLDVVLQRNGGLRLASTGFTAPSNYLTREPQVLDHTLTGVVLDFAPHIAGRVWSAIATKDSASSMTATSLLNNINDAVVFFGAPSCRLNSVTVSEGAQNRSLVGCNLLVNVLYTQLVYVTDNAANTGLLYKVDFQRTDDASLVSLTSSVAFTPTFTAGVLQYGGVTAAAQTSMTLSAAVNDGNATLSVSLAGSTYTQGVKSVSGLSINLVEGLNPIVITVQSQIKTTQAYKLNMRVPSGAKKGTVAKDLSLTLNLTFPASTQEQESFKTQFKSSVASALGIGAEQVLVQSLASGSTVVGFSITPPSVGRFTGYGESVVASLNDQLNNASSPLLTQGITANVLPPSAPLVVVTEEQELCEDLVWRARGTCPTGFALCAVDNACLNGGRCLVNETALFTFCECPPGFGGGVCQERVWFVISGNATLGGGGGGGATGNLTLSGTTGGDELVFQVSDLGATQAEAYLGPHHDPLRFPCTVTGYTPSVHDRTQTRVAHRRTVRCTVAPSYGAHNYITMRLAGIIGGQTQWYQTPAGFDVISHPPPVILDSTLRRPGFNVTIPFIAASLLGDIVTFNGVHLWHNLSDPGTVQDLTLLYGPYLDPQKYTCKLQSMYFNNVTCVLQPGDDKNMTMIIDLAGRSGKALLDIFSYPEVPSVTGVVGCSNSTGNATTDCPTEGGTIITITGTQLFYPFSITVGGSECAAPVRQLSSEGKLVSCALPPGTGFKQSVVAYQNNFLSLAQPFVSYARPTITRISSTTCESKSPLQLVNCNRYGGDVITLEGRNFGGQDAVVFIGLSRCASVVHGTGLEAHRKLVCQSSPSGINEDQTVVVVQGNGVLSLTPTFVSYTQCQPGFYEDVNGNPLNCLPCAPGSFTATRSATSCTLCNAREYSAVYNATTCTKCRPGRYQPEGNSTSCLSCVAGKFTNVEGRAECFPCVSGSFSAQPESTGCDLCPAGYYQPGANQTHCLVCPAGSYNNDTGRSRCIDCLPGSYSPGNASRTCTSCPPGSFANQERSSQCLLCEAGKFTDVPGQEECRGCVLGDTYALRAGSTACFNCPDRGVLCVPNNVATLDGWWMTNDGQGSIAVFACPDGKCEKDSSCGKNRRNVTDNLLCGQCLPDHSEWGGECVFCDKTNYILVIVFLIVSFLPVLGILWWQHRVHSRLNIEVGNSGGFNKGILDQGSDDEEDDMDNEGDLQRLSCWAALTACCRREDQGDQRDSTHLQSPQERQAQAELAQELAKAQGDKVKVFFYFISSILLIARSQSTFVGYLEYFNFKPAEAQPFCVAPLDGLQKLLLRTFTPIILLAELALVFVVSAAYHKVRFGAAVHRHFRVNAYIAAFTAIYLFGYTDVAVGTMQYLNCVDVNGERVIFEAPSVSCSSSRYQTFLPVMLGLLVLYVMGSPILVALFVIVKKQQMQAMLLQALRSRRRDSETAMRAILRDFMEKYGILFAGYDFKRVFWWEGFAILRRTIMALLETVFFTSAATLQAAFAMFNVLLLGLHVYVRPYQKFSTNFTEGMNYVVQACVAILLLRYGSLDTALDVFVGLISWGPVGFMISLMFLGRDMLDDAVKGIGGDLASTVAKGAVVVGTSAAMNKMEDRALDRMDEQQKRKQKEEEEKEEWEQNDAYALPVTAVAEDELVQGVAPVGVDKRASFDAEEDQHGAEEEPETDDSGPTNIASTSAAALLPTDADLTSSASTATRTMAPSSSADHVQLAALAAQESSPTMSDRSARGKQTPRSKIKSAKSSSSKRSASRGRSKHLRKTKSRSSEKPRGGKPNPSDSRPRGGQPNRKF